MSIILRFISVSLFLLFLLAQISYAATEQRTALVIGNGAYKSGHLKNPTNDATDISAALQKAGFTVILKKNATLKEMEEAIENFGNRLKRGGVGLFYFAGHGVQINGINYLIPIGAKINKESDVKYEAVDVNRILDEMANASNGLNIVMLDACRDNPYARTFRNAACGLAIVSTAPTGTFISYSTGPGQVAQDGEGRNSPYTAAVIQYMKQPGVIIEQVFKSVRAKLGKETGGKQIPWELSSLQGEFFFIPMSKDSTGRPATEEHSQVALIPPSPSEIDLSSKNEKYFKLLARDGWQDALNYFQSAVTTNPDDVDARAGLAIGMIFKGDDENARYNVRRIKEMDQQTKWTRISFGIIGGMEGDYENGKYQLNRAIEEGVDKALAYLCLAMIDIKKGNREQAKKYLDNYKALVPASEQSAPYKRFARKTDAQATYAKDLRTGFHGKITAQHGEAIYADLASKNYIGRLSKGAEIELVDRKVYPHPQYKTIKKYV